MTWSVCVCVHVRSSDRVALGTYLTHSGTQALIVDAEKYHTCHVLSMEKFNSGLTFMSDLNDFHHSDHKQIVIVSSVRKNCKYFQKRNTPPVCVYKSIKYVKGGFRVFFHNMNNLYFS